MGSKHDKKKKQKNSEKGGEAATVKLDRDEVDAVSGGGGVKKQDPNGPIETPDI